MKIAMVFDGLQIGGIERVGADYAKILCQLGHEVTIVNLDPSFSEMVNEFPATCMQINYKYTKKMSPESCCGIADRGGIYLGIFTIMYWIKFLISIWKKIIFKYKNGGMIMML